MVRTNEPAPATEKKEDVKRVAVEVKGGVGSGATTKNRTTSPKVVRVQRTRGDQEQDSKFLKELAVDRTFFQVPESWWF